MGASRDLYPDFASENGTPDDRDLAASPIDKRIMAECDGRAHAANGRKVAADAWLAPAKGLPGVACRRYLKQWKEMRRGRRNQKGAQK